MGTDAVYAKGLGVTEDRAAVIDEQTTGSHRPRGFGLCDSCENIVYSLTKYGTEVFYCAHDNNTRNLIRPSRFDPLIRCVLYSEFGKLSLATLWNMATLIDVKKSKIGFELDNETVTVSTEKLSPKDRLSRWHCD
jgi:hypothetical protein